MRKHYYLVLDVETANSTDDALVYDLGFAVADRSGKIYETHSYINSDIFTHEKNLMTSAYYAHKIPEYLESIRKGEREVANLYAIRQKVLDVFKRYPIRAVCAYNAGFDYKALNTTQRYITKSKYRYFLPYGVEVFDIWHMACQTICSLNKYYKFCIDNGFVSASGNISTSAETVYRFLTNTPTFVEEHKGLEDVLIEVAIMTECYKKHQKMKRNIYRACWRIPQRKEKKAE